jgi:hypothetical protein
MNLDLPGRVGNTILPSSRPLLPLFDAIINSIDAIEDRGIPDGRVVARVKRDTSQAELPIDAAADMRPIIGFVVSDNGVGFTDRNYESFDTADSTLKRSRGGKGVGRFLWLKAFETVLIDSRFVDADGSAHQRTFRFFLPHGIQEHSVSSIETTTPQTTIHLNGYRNPWASECPKTLEVIASRILDHCAGFFLRASCPAILLEDENGNQLSLNERFRTEYAPAPPIPFNVDSQSFSVRHLHIRDAQSRHRVYLCANTREVVSQQMALQDLPRRLAAPNGDTFVLASYVSGALLDSMVNSERTGFALSDRPEPGIVDTLSIQAIVDATAETLRSPFAVQLSEAAEERQRRLREYTEVKAPEYRILVNNYPERLTSVPVDAGDERIDQELHRVKRDLESETKTQVAELLKGAASFDDYEPKLAALLEKVNELGKSDLIKYVSHRRIVLEILSQSLRRQPSGKYGLEADIHKIVFPLHATSDDGVFREQNLWLIDERLAYHRYLASDSALGLPDEKDRPDLAIFNRPLAFDDADSSGSVVLIEFKRPMRQGYTDDDNPLEQVYGYVEKIREGKATRKDGRPIRVKDSSPFYAWILCDPTPSLDRHAKRANLLPSPDEAGYYGWNASLKTYVEVVTYDKLLSDAQKRNRAFFERLQIT